MTDAQLRNFLSRKEAAAYLSQRWFPITASTLASKAATGHGPEYRLTAPNGGRALYEPTELDRWAKNLPQLPQRSAHS